MLSNNNNTQQPISATRSRRIDTVLPKRETNTIANNLVRVVVSSLLSNVTSKNKSKLENTITTAPITISGEITKIYDDEE